MQKELLGKLFSACNKVWWSFDCSMTFRGCGMGGIDKIVVWKVKLFYILSINVKHAPRLASVLNLKKTALVWDQFMPSSVSGSSIEKRSVIRRLVMIGTIFFWNLDDFILYDASTAVPHVMSFRRILTWMSGKKAINRLHSRVSSF